MSKEVQDTDQRSSLEKTNVEAPPELSVDLDENSIDLSLRFLVGLLAIGSDEAARRLQEEQHRLDLDPTIWASETPDEDKSLRRKAWHLGVGLIRRSQRRLRRRLRSSYDLSRRAAGHISSTSNRWGVTTLTGPVRKPIAARIEEWRREAASIVKEGELEEQQGRALTTGALGSLTLEVMDEIAENPEMHEFVQDLIGQQGVGMATSVMDNARSVTLTADDAGEALLRWLLRRKPRRDLPPSPVEGQPQTMYVPTARVEGEMPDAD